jgi:hypothetical protein
VCMQRVPPLGLVPGGDRMVACHVVRKSLTGSYGVES